MGECQCLITIPHPPQVSPKDTLKLLDCMFMFALVWSIGGSTENEGRAKFSAFLHKLTAGVRILRGGSNQCVNEEPAICERGPGQAQCLLAQAHGRGEERGGGGEAVHEPPSVLMY